MGMSPIEFNFLHLAYQRGCLPSGGDILEFGECETVNLNVSVALEHILPAGAERDALTQQAAALNTRSDAGVNYDRAKLIYRALFGYESYAAIDLDPGADYRIQQDLNLPFNLGRQYDLCINNGTSEHVFNQANFYKAVHDHTRAGGTMIHWTPCLGWHDHGMFNVQPGFFHDLAYANDYEMLVGNLVTADKIHPLKPMSINATMIEGHPDLRDALACVVLRKKNDGEFRLPLQTVYKSLQSYQKS